MVRVALLIRVRAAGHRHYCCSLSPPKVAAAPELQLRLAPPPRLGPAEAASQPLLVGQRKVKITQNHLHEWAVRGGHRKGSLLTRRIHDCPRPNPPRRCHGARDQSAAHHHGVGTRCRGRRQCRRGRLTTLVRDGEVETCCSSWSGVQDCSAALLIMDETFFFFFSFSTTEPAGPHDAVRTNCKKHVTGTAVCMCVLSSSCPTTSSTPSVPTDSSSAVELTADVLFYGIRPH